MMAPEAFIAVVLLLWLLIYLFVIMDNALNPRLISRPRLFLTQVRSASMADLLTYAVSVGPVVDADVVERQLVVVVDGAGSPEDVKVFPADTTDLGTVTVPQGSSVVMTLVDVDDAGNRSEPAVLEFVAEDTLPPARPGSFGVTLVGEKPADVVPEEKPVDEA
jgi:hypothetical protein